MSTDKILMDVLGRVIELEDKMSVLQAKVDELDKTNHGELVEEIIADSRDQEERTGAATRRDAVEALKEKLQKHHIDYKITGPNRPMFVIGSDGTDKRFRLWASRNDLPENEVFSSWHTVDAKDVESGDYDFFVLSVEDEKGTPVFFVLTLEQMRAVAKKKITSGGSYWIYIQRTAPGSKKFIEVRDGDIDFTPYYEQWSVLQDA